MRRPHLYSYEGENPQGTHQYSICCYDSLDDETHECFATVQGKTEQEAKDRAELIVKALGAWLDVREG